MIAYNFNCDLLYIFKTTFQMCNTIEQFLCGDKDLLGSFGHIHCYRNFDK